MQHAWLDYSHSGLTDSDDDITNTFNVAGVASAESAVQRCRDGDLEPERLPELERNKTQREANSAVDQLQPREILCRQNCFRRFDLPYVWVICSLLCEVFELSGVWIMGVGDPDFLWKYVGVVRVFWCPKMSHSFIQNCCWMTLRVSYHKGWTTCVKNGR